MPTARYGTMILADLAGRPDPWCGEEGIPVGPDVSIDLLADETAAAQPDDACQESSWPCGPCALLHDCHLRGIDA